MDTHHVGVASGKNSQAEKGAGARSGVVAAACGRAALGRARERAGSGSEGGGDRAVHWAVISDLSINNTKPKDLTKTSTDLNQTNLRDETQK